jgi:hypothetical protein
MQAPIKSSPSMHGGGGASAGGAVEATGSELDAAGVGGAAEPDGSSGVVAEGAAGTAGGGVGGVAGGGAEAHAIGAPNPTRMMAMKAVRER